MKKIVFIVFIFLLLFISIGYADDTDMKMQKMFDDFESRIFQHLKTNKITMSLQTRYMAIPGVSFRPRSQSDLIEIDNASARSGSNTTAVTLYAPVTLPQNAIVISLTGVWYRDDAAASGTLNLIRRSYGGVGGTMASVDSNVTSGYHTVIDDSIDYSQIDNTGYFYILDTTLDPNDNNSDVKLLGCLITYTVITPLP